MALLFMDGCDHVDAIAQLAGKWDTATAFSIQTTNGRFGGGAYYMNTTADVLSKTLPAQKTTVISSFAIKLEEVPTGGSSPCHHFRNSADGNHFSLQLVEDTGQIRVWDTDGIAATSARGLTAAIWNHIEVKVKCDDTTGTIEVRVNEDVWINLTNRDTRSGADLIDRVAWNVQTTNADWLLDDLSIMDDAGSANNDFSGDSRIWTLNPNAAGNNARFSPDSGNNFERVDEAFPPDGDTSYVESDSNGYKDLYLSDALPETVAVDAMQANVYAKKDSAPAREMALCLRSGVTGGPGASQALTTTYQYFSEVWEDDPSTGSPWTTGGIDAAQLGQEISL